VRLTLTAMAVHAAGYPPGLAGGYHSFLSHLEDFLYLNDRNGQVRARFEKEWHRLGDEVTEQVRLAADGQATADPVAAAWSDWVEKAWQICAPAWERGEIPLPGDEYARLARQLGAEAVQRWDPRQRPGHSEYHTTLFRADFFSLPGIAEHFGPYRFATNILYQLLVLCDVTPVERYLAAYLLSQAVVRLTGMTWQQAMAAYTSDGDEAASGSAADSCLSVQGRRS